MEIAPDFFSYFEAAAALLDKDKYVSWSNQTITLYWNRTSSFLLTFMLQNCRRSIMAVSSWNDNGQKQFVQDPCEFPSNFSLSK